MAEVNVFLAVAILSVVAGVLLCARAVISRRGIHAMHGAILAAIGGAMLLAGGSPSLGRWPIHENDTLRALRQERFEVERSLYGRIVPLLARCHHELKHLEGATERPGVNAAERSRVLSTLEETQLRQREHEQALSELNAAIAALERGEALTQVKDVTHARAAARVALGECTTTQDEHQKSTTR